MLRMWRGLLKSSPFMLRQIGLLKISGSERASNGGGARRPRTVVNQHEFDTATDETWFWQEA